MKRVIFKICGWILDVCVIAGLEVIQFLLLAIQILSYLTIRKHLGWHICIAGISNICVMAFMRYIAIKGMPSKWLIKLIEKE